MNEDEDAGIHLRLHGFVDFDYVLRAGDGDDGACDVLRGGPRSVAQREDCLVV